MVGIIQEAETLKTGLGRHNPVDGMLLLRLFGPSSCVDPHRAEDRETGIFKDGLAFLKRNKNKLSHE